MFYCALCLNSSSEPKIVKVEEKEDYDPLDPLEYGWTCPNCESGLYTEEIMDVKEIKEYLAQEKLRISVLEQALKKLEKSS